MNITRKGPYLPNLVAILLQHLTSTSLPASMSAALIYKITTTLDRMGSVVKWGHKMPIREKAPWLHSQPEECHRLMTHHGGHFGVTKACNRLHKLGRDINIGLNMCFPRPLTCVDVHEYLSCIWSFGFWICPHMTDLLDLFSFCGCVKCFCWCGFMELESFINTMIYIFFWL